MKKNKLYTVTKGNKHLFSIGGNAVTINTNSGGISGLSNYMSYGNLGAQAKPGELGSSSYTPVFSSSNASDVADMKKLNGSSNQFLTGNENMSAASGGSAWGSLAAGIGSNLLAMADKVPTGDRRGLWDTLDPGYNAGKTKFADGSSGHYETKVGNALSDIGIALTGGGANNALGAMGAGGDGSAGGYMALAGAAFKIAGDIINNGWGMAYNDKKIGEVKQNTKDMQDIGNALAKASSTSDLLDASGYMKGASGYSTDMLVKGGVFKKEDARNEGYDFLNRENSAQAYQNKGLRIGAENADRKIDDKAMSTFVYAFGGPMGPMPIYGSDNIGAIEYGFMSDYLTNKKKQLEQKNNINAGVPPTFAFGGDLQTNGSDWTSGLTHINAGGSHETSPYEGVQIGVDNKGNPNLVEENETIYDDYVYSNRILADQQTKEKFRLPKKKDFTFADISKKLEKQVKERENDPIAQAGFKSEMYSLRDEQERQKQEMEAERARAAFEALSPEEQTAVMQRVAQEEATAQQVAQEQQMASDAQPSPEEVAMAQQQMADGSEAAISQEPQQFAEGGKKNVGKWKDKEENHWDVFTRPGLKKYIENLKARLEKAPDEETKATIRKAALNELNSLQQSYYDYVREGAANATHGYDDNILNHQKMFDSLYGNTGFYTTDENGNVRNLIAEAIDLPKGAATDDKPDNWFDGYNGPRTSIRNFGSTAYGDDKYYQDLVDEFKELGLTYAPNDNWKDDSGILYGLSIPEEEAAKAAIEEAPKVWDSQSEEWVDKTPSEAVAQNEDVVVKKGDVEDMAPKQKAEWLRYAGLLGPAAGLGMMAAGIGKPDTSGLDAAVAMSRNGTTMADYKPIGDYLMYRPMDIWAGQNRLNANSRATDRMIMNNASPIGTRMAGLLANAYNNQIASGELYRNALEYNDNLRKMTGEFNKDTNKFNADTYNRTSQFNADARNRAKQTAAGLAIQAAKEKMDADAGWYNSLYGNVGNLFRGISDIGTENYRMNRIAEMAARGDFGTATDDTYGFEPYLTRSNRKSKKNR